MYIFINFLNVELSNKSLFSLFNFKYRKSYSICLFVQTVAATITTATTTPSTVTVAASSTPTPPVTTVQTVQTSTPVCITCNY